jgi:hypothetical protein
VTERRLTGGCLCGQLRYEVRGAPKNMGFCYCAECRKASGSGFIPFMGFPADQLTVTGRTRQHRTQAFRGGESVRNFCPDCGGLVFGGVLGRSVSHTVYAGSLDDPSAFVPQMAIFLRDRPAWVAEPVGIAAYDTMPE